MSGQFSCHGPYGPDGSYGLVHLFRGFFAFRVPVAPMPPMVRNAPCFAFGLLAPVAPMSCCCGPFGPYVSLLPWVLLMFWGQSVAATSPNQCGKISYPTGRQGAVKFQLRPADKKPLEPQEP